jgi:uncharacterized membrane protein YqiK
LFRDTRWHALHSSRQGRCATFVHCTLVCISGSRGVWNKPLLPGKYAFNTYAGKVITVPTTNFVLKWAKETIGMHRLDENLSKVALITKDAFEPPLPLSVVVHIDYMRAPLVVQRFGNIRRLVEQLSTRWCPPISKTSRRPKH